MEKIIPCLWFNDNAEEAVEFYVSLIRNSRVGLTSRYSDAVATVAGRPKGSIMTIEFQLHGQKFLALNGGPHFTFSPATSFFVHCESKKEIDHLWDRIAEGGAVFMALDKYPWSERYGWVQDRFGVSWQLMLTESKQKIVPCLLFVKEQHGRAEEAMNYYTSQFERSEIVVIDRYGSDEPGPEGTVKYARFNLAGQEFVVMDGPGEHPFAFSPAISFIVNCDTQDEIDRYWVYLSRGGREDQCGWLQDKFGVSWQIVPGETGKWIGQGTRKQSERVMEAILPMKKLDLNAMKQAYENA